MEKGELSDKQQKQLQIAQKHANEMGNLIEQFFEYSYLLNAESQPNIKQLNLTNLVTECLADSIAVFEENQLTVHLEETQPVFVFADKEMTVRIVHNLIRNCVTHSVGTIKVAIQNKENAVVSFTNLVKKSGDIEIDRLFDRFYTADKARSKNTGLGLSIVQKLSEQMGGRASASLNKDIITIYVELPLYEKG
ncbi:sensor histidine kinase [Bacillus sp. JJ722]|uniref:sensor histidine kinase n=1 Tax=Bacillus sp. JJ722 TaxID=3122973 RepID=UPI002FFF0EF9